MLTHLDLRVSSHHVVVDAIGVCIVVRQLHTGSVDVLPAPSVLGVQAVRTKVPHGRAQSKCPSRVHPDGPVQLSLDTHHHVEN